MSKINGCTIRLEFDCSMKTEAHEKCTGFEWNKAYTIQGNKCCFYFDGDCTKKCRNRSLHESWKKLIFEQSKEVGELII